MGARVSGERAPTFADVAEKSGMERKDGGVATGNRSLVWLPLGNSVGGGGTVFSGLPPFGVAAINGRLAREQFTSTAGLRRSAGLCRLS